MPPNPAAQPPNAVAHGATLWGIALSGSIGITIPKGLGARNIVQKFCQVPKAICPLYTRGLRSHMVSVNENANWQGNAYSVSAAGESKLGSFSFRDSLSTTSASQHVNQSVVAMTTLDWYDYLTIVSASAPVGTRAKFKVTTSVVPAAIDAPCNDDAGLSIDFDLQSTGIPGSGYETVHGECIGGKFKFYTTSRAHPGTVATVTLSGTVGQTLDIQGDGAVDASLCQTLGCKHQRVGAAGLVRYTIVSLTKGVGFKTASGAAY